MIAVEGGVAGNGIEEIASIETERLLRLARGILGDPQEAEDAVQDALVIAWQSWDQLRDPLRRSAWLTRICVRRCLRLKVAMARRSGGELEDVAAADPASWAEWDQAFARLSRRQRAVVVLHYLHGYTLDECAEAIGSRPGSVRRHLARALARLRKEIER